MSAKKIYFIDLFCGAGGMSTGFELAGYKSVWANDHEKVFCETYQANHPDAFVFHGDITKIDVLDIKKQIGGKKISLVVGGPPCQGFSHAGLRDPKDPRNSLFMDFVRIVAGFKPRYFVMENVPGILNMKTHEGLLVVDIIQREFSKIGYVLEKKILRAADYGVPQKRRRVIFLGTIKKSKGQLPLQFPEPTHSEIVESSLFNNHVKPWVPVKEVLQPKSAVDKSFFHTKAMIEGFIRRQKKNKELGNGFGWQILDMEKPSYTISARYWKDGSDALVKYSDHEIRMLTPRECANIQTFPNDYKFKGSKKYQYMQIGNAVPCLLAKAIGDQLKKHL